MAGCPAGVATSTSSSPIPEGQNVQCGVHVRIVRVPASGALEVCLFPAILVDVPALAAGLAGVRRRHLAHVHLVVQAQFQRAPCAGQDLPVQSRFRLHILAGIHCSFPWPSFVSAPDVQLLHVGDIVLGGDALADVVAQFNRAKRSARNAFCNRTFVTLLRLLPFTCRAILTLVSLAPCHLERKVGNPGFVPSDSTASFLISAMLRSSQTSLMAEAEGSC